MESTVLSFILRRMMRIEQQDRARFLETSAELQETCACASCSQAGLQPAWHVAANLVMVVLGLPWYAAIVHVLLLANT